MQHLTRRQLLQALGAGAATLALAPRLLFAEEIKGYPYTLPKLPYAYDALEPSIDAKTMMIHHDKHHAGYVTNLNAALKDHPDVQKIPLTTLLSDTSKIPEAIRQAVINNGGGHINHSMFWVIMGPNAGGEPSGALAKAIDAAFESFAKFQAKLTDSGMKRFGSGWAWLVTSGKGKLEIVSTANQDSPLSKGQTPLLGVDVWEHAYYLKYQNRRKDYLDAWWKVVNWKHVADKFGTVSKG